MSTHKYKCLFQYNYSFSSNCKNDIFQIVTKDASQIVLSNYNFDDTQKE